jgi:hypothetical protein
MHMLVAIFQLIPAHTWTFTGCFAFGLTTEITASVERL